MRAPKAEAVIDFGPGDHDDRACRGHFVEAIANLDKVPAAIL